MEEKKGESEPVPPQYQPVDPQAQGYPQPQQQPYPQQQPQPQPLYPVQQYPVQPQPPAGQPPASAPGQPGVPPPPVTGQPVAQPLPGQPGHPGLVQVQQPGGTVVVTVPPVKFTAYPVNMQCSNCGNNILTDTHKEIGMVTWLFVGGLCLVLLSCLLCPLGLIGLCIPGLKDTVHSCPNCKHTLGRHKHL